MFILNIWRGENNDSALGGRINSCVCKCEKAGRHCCFSGGLHDTQKEDWLWLVCWMVGCLVEREREENLMESLGGD